MVEMYIRCWKFRT